MNFAELTIFLHDDCDSSRRKFNTASMNGVKFDHVSIFGNSKAVVFSNPVMTLSFGNIIHTDKTELEDGSIKLGITCKDEFTGVKYYEEIILSSSHS